MRLQALLNLLVPCAACATMLLMPMTASARKWHDTFVFDACKQRFFVELDSRDEKPFDRREHVVKAGTPVSLSVRYPRLFTSYRVLVEVQEVPEAIPLLRGVGELPSIDVGLAGALPETKGAREIQAIEIPRATIESVLRAFLTRESARRLILQIQTDRQAIVDGARTMRADVRALYDAVEPILGEGSSGPPYDRVPALYNAVDTLHKKLDIHKKDFCSLPKHKRKSRIAHAPEREKIRRRIEETDQLAVNYRRIGDRWEAARVAGLVDKVIDDAEQLDTRMNTFLDNLRAHEAALELLAGLIPDNGERVLPATH